MHSNGSSGDLPPIARRRVYYISGVDPRGPRFYHQMWQAEARQQRLADDRLYEVGAAADDGLLATRWTVRARADGQDTESEHVFLRWDDLMRDLWPASRLGVVARMPGMYWLYLRCGMLARTWSFARPFFWAYFAMPLLYVLLSLLIVGGTGWAAATLVAALGGSAWTRLAIGSVAVLAVLWALAENGDRTRLSWLASAHVFMVRWARDGPEPFAQRWRDFAGRIQADLQRDTAQSAPDEVLIVGHCGGAPAAVAVAQCWLALQPGGDLPAGSPVKLLTLGQAIPLIGMVPQAGWFREQLRQVGASRLPWLDYTAPADPLCYRLTDPFAICGLASPQRPGFRVKSARFDRMFPPAEYAALRRDIFNVHFQYLKSTRLPVANDYFRLTCGALPLDVA
jgi:hypothetical protein